LIWDVRGSGGEIEPRTLPSIAGGAQRNQSLDGLRGLAVLLVLLYHHALLNLGWLGVDLFFVLSGYLITGILRRTTRDKSYWTEFWVKRVTRILPPFLVLLCAATAFGDVPAKLFPLYIATLGDVVAVMHPSVETARPLWSLAVEEHFYLLWPIAVRYLNRRRLMQMLGVMLVVEPVLRFCTSYFGHTGWEFIYFLTPFRLDGIMMGSLLALLLERKQAEQTLQRVSLPLCAATVALYVALRILFSTSFTRGGNSPVYNALSYWVVALAAFWLISYLLLRPHGVGARVFSSRPLTWVGQISYGVYLYQVFLRDRVIDITHLPMRRAILVTAPVTLLVSWLSFRYMEEPLILWGKRKARQYRLGTGGAELASRTAAP
jgi:peptidoglycan/LPS O-acetylase OafA/YrhL